MPWSSVLTYKGSDAWLLDSWGSYCHFSPAAWRLLILLPTKVFHQGLAPQHARWDALKIAIVLDFLSNTKIWWDQFETLSLPPQQQNSTGQKKGIPHAKTALVPCKGALYFPYLTKPCGNFQGAPDPRKGLPLSAVQQLGAVRTEGAFRGVGLLAVVLPVVSFMAILFFPPVFF